MTLSAFEITIIPSRVAGVSILSSSMLKTFNFLQTFIQAWLALRNYILTKGSIDYYT